MTNSQTPAAARTAAARTAPAPARTVAAPARTADRRGTAPAAAKRQSPEPDIKALWAPVLQLLNGGPSGYTSR
jgi:hypothetical protein